MLECSEEEYASICCSPVHVGSLQDGHIVFSEHPQEGPIAMTDALGNTWCADCIHRGEFVNWGKVHGYPELSIHPYAMAQGAYYWQTTATSGDESRVWTFLGLIEMKEEEVA